MELFGEHSHGKLMGLCYRHEKERERMRFRKRGNAWPEVDFYGGNADFCDEKGDRCVMYICVFCPCMYDTSKVLFLL